MTVRTSLRMASNITPALPGAADRRPAAVRLKAGLEHATVAHPQIKARLIPAALVLVHAHAVRFPHQPGVARVEEVVEQRRAVPHAAPTGSAARNLRTSGSTDSIT